MASPTPRKTAPDVPPRERHAKRQLALGLLTITLVLVSGFGAAELGLRIADRFGWIHLWSDLRQARESSIWTLSPDPRLIYLHRPDYVTDDTRHTESHGILRPTNVELKPGSDVYRFAVLGDSVAAALDLPYEQRMFTLVEHLLVDSVDSSSLEVLNFAVNGYSTGQQATLLETLVRDYDPDLLILQFCMNDFHPTRFPAKWFLEYPRSYVLTLGKFVLDRRLLDGYPQADYWRGSFLNDHQGWASVVDGFDRISKYARSRDIPVLVVVFPLLSQNGWHEADAAGRHARVVELGRSLGMETLDLLPILSQHPVEELRRKPWDTFHLNAEGHRIVAAEIARTIQKISTSATRLDDGSPRHLNPPIPSS